MKIVSGDDEASYVGGMAASDAGFVYDGELVGAAAVAHLPIGILINMRMHHQWYHDLFNRWTNSMNIIADNNIYPELIGGEAWFGKITDTLAEWYLYPGRRYDQVRKWERFLKDAMAYKKIDRQVHSQSRDIIGSGEAVDEFEDPDYLLGTQMMAQIDKYNNPLGDLPSEPVSAKIGGIY